MLCEKGAVARQGGGPLRVDSAWVPVRLDHMSAIGPCSTSADLHVFFFTFCPARRRSTTFGHAATDLPPRGIRHVTGFRWTARVRAGTEGPAVTRIRAHALLSDSPLGLGVRDAAPSALDHLLTALGSDLLLRLQAGLRRHGLAVDSIELSLQAELENPLAALGVRGETGSPALAGVAGSCYLTSALGREGQALVEDLWREAQAGSPVTQTLRRACPVEIALKFL